MYISLFLSVDMFISWFMHVCASEDSQMLYIWACYFYSTFQLLIFHLTLHVLKYDVKFVKKSEEDNFTHLCVVLLSKHFKSNFQECPLNILVFFNSMPHILWAYINITPVS